MIPISSPVVVHRDTDDLSGFGEPRAMPELPDLLHVLAKLRERLLGRHVTG